MDIVAGELQVEQRLNIKIFEDGLPDILLHTGQPGQQV